MVLANKFPWTSRTFRAVAGRRPFRRFLLTLVMLLLCFATITRVRSYFMARKIQAVLHGLSQLRIDQTNEAQLARMVPYLEHGKEWNYHGFPERPYHVVITNETDRTLPRILRYCPDFVARMAYWMGYRYMDFDATVSVHDGKVTHVSYGLSREWTRPKAVGYIVSAESAHGFWQSYDRGFTVSSEDDQSPDYRPSGNKEQLGVVYTENAAPEVTAHAFELNLSCFWGFSGCEDARDIAPELWNDAEAVRRETLDRLRAGRCPDTIIEGRMRYLPDMSVLLLEVTGSRRILVNEEGSQTEDWLTDYKLKEVMRGQDSQKSWRNVRFGRLIADPMHPGRFITNQVWPPTKLGSQVLYFGNMNFESCRFIPATASSLQIARRAYPSQKWPEDQIVTGLM